MKLRKSSLDNLVLATGLILFISILALPDPDSDWDYYDTVKYASSTLKGHIPFSDFAAMVVGVRALANKTDPYPTLGTAFRDLGIDWDVRHGSNHPPTSYLLAAPVAFFSWPLASAAWAWLMLALIVLGYRFYGLSWKMALGLMPVTLLWPPASASLGQVTVVWMFGLALAYRFRKSRLFWSGVSVGLASLSKYMPALLMILFLVRRKWRAIAGFATLWVVSLSIVSILNPAAIPRYVEENRHTTIAIIERPDNASPLLVSYRYGGWVGAASLILFLALVAFVNRRSFSDGEDFPSTRAWMLLGYFSVACLPIFWIYSLLPLLPVLIFLLCERKVVTAAIVLLCLLVPFLFVRGGELYVVLVAGICVLTGLAFMLDVSSLKLLQKRWPSG
ncbi:MAG TPA: glycosyltransferase family 87 protein [Pyrinomonadaceae bacterium]|nr:glycosyltransferase family 87 protein [Pyrinomonadaceae bacterium]